MHQERSAIGLETSSLAAGVVTTCLPRTRYAQNPSQPQVPCWTDLWPGGNSRRVGACRWGFEPRPAHLAFLRPGSSAPSLKNHRCLAAPNFVPPYYLTVTLVVTATWVVTWRLIVEHIDPTKASKSKQCRSSVCIFIQNMKMPADKEKRKDETNKHQTLVRMLCWSKCFISKCFQHHPSSRGRGWWWSLSNSCLTVNTGKI
jgi:hypothetical protein